MNVTGNTRSSGRLCHSVISPMTLSVIRESVSFDTLAPDTSPKRPAISRVVRSYVLSDNRTSSTPVSRCCRFLTIRGSNVEPVSRGISISTGPISVSTVLVRVPLREFPLPRPDAPIDRKYDNFTGGGMDEATVLRVLRQRRGLLLVQDKDRVVVEEIIFRKLVKFLSDLWPYRSAFSRRRLERQQSRIEGSGYGGLSDKWCHVRGGVDGSEASVEAHRQAQRLAVPLRAKVLATAYWDDPQVYAGYVAMGIDRFEERVTTILNDAIEQAFGQETPPNVIPRVIQGHPRDSLIDASRHADMIVVGRRGHGGISGLLLGSVSSACVAHAHCPVLVVHSPDKDKREGPQ